jgi:hypothetical protein
MKTSSPQNVSLHLAPLAGRGRIALAIRVRGSIREYGNNRFKYSCHVAQHVVIPKTQKAVVVIGEPLFANHIVRTVGVLSSVRLDNKATFAANQIDRVRPDRFLPHEFVSIEPARPQAKPQRRFRIGGSSPQAPGTPSLPVISRAQVDVPPHPARSNARRPLPARGARLAPRARP